MFNPFVLLSAMILFGLSPAPGPAPQAAQAPAAAPAQSHIKTTTESQAKAKKLYQVDCAVCHGDNGSGKTDLAKDMQLALDDWSDPKSLAGKSDEALFNTIRKGKDKMPAEEAGRAKDDEVWNLIVYIRSMSKNTTAAATPATPPTN